MFFQIWDSQNLTHTHTDIAWDAIVGFQQWQEPDAVKKLKGIPSKEIRIAPVKNPSLQKLYM